MGWEGSQLGRSARLGRKPKVGGWSCAYVFLGTLLDELVGFYFLLIYLWHAVAPLH